MKPLLSFYSRQESNALYESVLRDQDTAAMRALCQRDLFFLLTVVCKRQDINRDWLYQRCREVELEPDGYLDLWAREHYKSTIVTFGLTIQDILKNPSVTVGIFSQNRPIAKAFLKQIKEELENNQLLKDLFPDILWANPGKDAPTWSLDGGITVQRSTNPKECTVEAWGLVDSQPTSKHFSLLIYDDAVTQESVSTPDMIAKTTEAWGLSLSLGAAGGKRRTIGTRYHFNDTYKTMMERLAVKPRIYAATEDGSPNGKPVLMSAETLAERRLGGPYIFSCQYLQNPVADDAQGFKEDWLRLLDGEVGEHGGAPANLNVYMLVDPANAKKKTNDFTAIGVIGLGPDGNFYLLDLVRDRLNLTERTKKVFELWRKWRPIKVGYERYGMQADIEHIRYVQAQRQERFEIVELGGQTSKVDRIRKLIPIFEAGRFWMPRRIVYIDYERKSHDLIGEFLRDEYYSFPVAVHEDVFDMLARIVEEDLGAVFPASGPVRTGRRKTKVNNTYKVL